MAPELPVGCHWIVPLRQPFLVVMPLRGIPDRFQHTCRRATFTSLLILHRGTTFLTYFPRFVNSDSGCRTWGLPTASVLRVWFTCVLINARPSSTSTAALLARNPVAIVVSSMLTLNHDTPVIWRDVFPSELRESPRNFSVPPTREGGKHYFTFKLDAAPACTLTSVHIVAASP